MSSIDNNKNIPSTFKASLRTLSSISLMLSGLVFATTAQSLCEAITPTSSNMQLQDNLNGTVTDNATGLMWKQCSEGQTQDSQCNGTASGVSFQQALQIPPTVNSSGFAGFNDWRLPNIKELRSIVEAACHTPAINLDRFPNTAAIEYWSSSISIDAIDKAWQVEFVNGESNASRSDRISAYAVRLVRTHNVNPDTAAKELIANAYSGNSIGLTWQEDGATYTIYRDNAAIATTSNHHYVDNTLAVNTSYSYVVTRDINNPAATVTVVAKTLVNNTNPATENGAETVIDNDRVSNFSECNNVRNALLVDDADLDTCLAAMLTLNNMAGHLEDMRAFSARVRSEQSPEMVALGMRLFHSKSLSGQGDTSCSSCHHPALGCGGDDLSMPIGVNAAVPKLLGPGRTDGNSVPIVPRNSPATCNTALWSRGLFWDNRVAATNRGINTESNDVSNNTIAAVSDGSLMLLMAQAHFPVTAAPEMGDVTQFGYDESVDSDLTAYRETVLAANLNAQAWGPLFAAAFGDATINYSRIAEAIAAYEAVQIFIDNPFFDYVDGDTNAISNDEKRGAITFMTSSTGCTFCHAGAFFTTEAQLPGNYPQIGVGNDASGNGADYGAEGLTGPGAFRAPTLLNVAITGPWGHNGQFATLERNVAHYQNHGDSIASYFANSEMCDLAQFSELADCANTVASNGLALSQEILSGNVEFSNNLSQEEVNLVAQFLRTLTDPDAANTQSNAIQSLIPPRDAGPDGNQLDAEDEHGNPL